MVIFVVYSLTAEVGSSVNNVTRGHTVNIGRQCWMVRGLHGRNLNTRTRECDAVISRVYVFFLRRLHSQRSAVMFND